MYKIKLFIPETNATHALTGPDFCHTVILLLQEIRMTYDDEFAPELYEGIFKLSEWAIHGEGEPTYNHYDMSCPEENFVLGITEVK